MKLYLTCLYILHRWHIVAVFWRGAVSRVGTRQERRRICHFTLGGNPSRVTIVLDNRQEMVKHIILTRWALWHGQFYCCHRWKEGRKEGNSLSCYSEQGQMKMLSSFSIFLFCIFAFPCLCVCAGLSLSCLPLCRRQAVSGYYGDEKTAFKRIVWRFGK